jgi:hypothetical protein
MTFKVLIISALSCFCMNAYAQQAFFTGHVAPNTADLKVQRFETGINSTSADFAPARYGDRIYFTSIFTIKEKKETQHVSRIYSFTPGEQPQLEMELNSKKSGIHIANVALMPDASRMYYTLCKDDQQQDCELWYREKEYEGAWSVAKKMPEPINLRGYTTTQPSIGWDLTMKKFVLYFVSDRPGGAGKLDIWASPITWDGKFETPYPLAINSPQDDVTPFFHRSSQTLYFSSNGRKGIGRFDVYRSSKSVDGTWANPANLGRPFNTAYDDLYFTLHDGSQTAYFSSDRPGSISTGAIDGWDCYDLYKIEFEKKYVEREMAMED